MKKPNKSLRARTLDTEGLAKVHGGRGICHGYYECLDCGQCTFTAWDTCPGCGAPFDPVTGTYREVMTTVPDEQAKMRAQQLDSEIYSVDNRIRQTRDQQTAINGELSKMRTEMASL